MRKIVYSVASSLDGFIAGPKGEMDWIVMDPDVDFEEGFQRFDTLLVGRKTFEPMAAAGRTSMPGMRTIVFSRSRRQDDFPDVTVANDAEKALLSLREEPGKDIWLFGGGTLFESLVHAGLVDVVSVALMPVLLGAGVPLLPRTSKRVKLELTKHERSEKAGSISLEYAVHR